MEYEIEKGIEMPKYYKYPFDKMEIGDAFFIGSQDIVTDRRLVQAHASYFRKTKNKEFTISARRATGRLRIWRIQ